MQVITIDAFLHLFEVTDDDKDLITIRGRHDLQNFCSLLDRNVDLSNKSPFASVDVKNSTITPIFIPIGQVLMKSHSSYPTDDKRHHYHGANQEVHRHNAFYVCRHTNPPKKKNVLPIGDFCLWTATKESTSKWLKALDDPLTAKKTYSDADVGTTEINDTRISLGEEQEELEDVFDASISGEEKESDLTTHEKGKVEQPLTAEVVEGFGGNAASQDVDGIERKDQGSKNGNIITETFQARRSLVNGVSDYVCQR